MTTGNPMVLDATGLREIDRQGLPAVFVEVIRIMCSGKDKGYTPEMSRENGLEWVLGDANKRRTAGLAAFQRGDFGEARDEMLKGITDFYIAIRDFVDYEERREVKLEDMRDEAKGVRFTKEDYEWVNGQDYIAAEVCCEG